MKDSESPSPRRSETASSNQTSSTPNESVSEGRSNEYWSFDHYDSSESHDLVTVDRGTGSRGQEWLGKPFFDPLSFAGSNFNSPAGGGTSLDRHASAPRTYKLIDYSGFPIVTVDLDVSFNMSFGSEKIETKYGTLDLRGKVSTSSGPQIPVRLYPFPEIPVFIEASLEDVRVGVGYQWKGINFTSSTSLSKIPLSEFKVSATVGKYGGSVSADFSFHKEGVLQAIAAFERNLTNWVFRGTGY